MEPRREPFLLLLKFDGNPDISAYQAAQVAEIVGQRIIGTADVVHGFVVCFGVRDSIRDSMGILPLLRPLFTNRITDIKLIDDNADLTFEELSHVALVPPDAVEEVHYNLMRLTNSSITREEGLLDLVFGRLPPAVPNTWPGTALPALRLHTGDVLLFAGNYKTSVQLRQLQWSRYSHAALVVRDDADSLKLLQSTSDRGVTLDELADVLRMYDGTIVVRQLHVEEQRRSSMQKEALAFARDVVAYRYTSPVALIGMWFEQAIVGKGWSARKAFFCSQLVAQAYMEMGLLPRRPMASVYIPERFAHDTRFPLPLLSASLGEPIRVLV